MGEEQLLVLSLFLLRAGGGAKCSRAILRSLAVAGPEDSFYEPRKTKEA